MKKITTRNMVLIALLSGISYLFFMFEIRIIDPLQFDLSDLFVMIAGYLLGVVPGILVALLKNILHLMFKSEGLIGELTNFIYALLIMIPLVKLKAKNLNQVLVTTISIVIFVTLMINVFNYFIAMPIYGIAQEIRIPMILSTFVPFNLLKTSALLIIFYFVKPFLNRLDS